MLTACPHLKRTDEVEIFRIDHAEGVGLCHVYMEAQIFTPDSKRFVVHSGATAHGEHNGDPALHRYYRCDLDDNCALAPLTDEPQAIAPSLSPDGRTMYYFLDHSVMPDSGKTGIELKRVSLDGTGRETLLVLDGKLPGTRLRGGKVYPLSTISSDGKRLAMKLAARGDAGVNHAVLVFDLDTLEAWMPLLGEEWINVHPQYSRSLDPGRSHDLMVQHNHGMKIDAAGKALRHHDGLGMDIHVIRDDGTGLRDFPWGRALDEICVGHQCWVGRGAMAIGECQKKKVFYQDGFPSPAASPGAERSALVAGLPGEPDGHRGQHTPGTFRFDLCGALERPCRSHFATDIAGRRLIGDGCPWEVQNVRFIYTTPLPADWANPTVNWRMVADTRTSGVNAAHPHPFLSPDGALGFFNSDESGVLRPYLIRNLKFPNKGE